MISVDIQCKKISKETKKKQFEIKSEHVFFLVRNDRIFLLPFNNHSNWCDAIEV